MHIEQFFHIVRAACAIANVETITVFGANALLPWLRERGILDMRHFLEPTQVSRELDLCVGDGADDTLNTLIDGAIGELSQFDATFGVYARPNPLNGLFRAPSTWRQRVRREREPVSQVQIIVPHYLDLSISKILAGRPKDEAFVIQVARLFAVACADLEELLAEYVWEYPAEKSLADRQMAHLKSRLKSA